MITVSVQFHQDKLCEVKLRLDDTVEALRLVVAKHIHTDFKLIHSGKIMQDQLTLGYYGLTDNARVFVFARYPKPERRQSPRDLLLAAFHSTRGLDSCSYDEYCDRIVRITMCLNDANVQRLADTDPWAAKVVHHIIDFAENCVRQLSASEMRALCQIEDTWLLQLDNTLSGMRALQEALDDLEPESPPPIPTVLPSTAPTQVSEAPLPACWWCPVPQRVGLDVKSGMSKSPPPFAHPRCKPCNS